MGQWHGPKTFQEIISKISLLAWRDAQVLYLVWLQFTPLMHLQLTLARFPGVISLTKQTLFQDASVWKATWSILFIKPSKDHGQLKVMQATNTDLHANSDKKKAGKKKEKEMQNDKFFMEYQNRELKRERSQRQRECRLKMWFYVSVIISRLSQLVWLAKSALTGGLEIRRR